MKNLLLLPLFLALSLPAGAVGSLKWGKVSKEELALTVCDYDSSAVAVMLDEAGKVTFAYGSDPIIYKHFRIKILDDKGLDYADVRLPFYVKDNLESINGIRAQTINVEPDGSITKHEVSNKEIFEVRLDDRWSEKRFTFPNVRKGSIIEYSYRTYSESVVFLEGWVFQNDIPTLHSAFEAEIPSGLDYRVLYQGTRLLKNYSETPTSKWELEDLPAIRKEVHAPHLLDYVEKIRFQLAGYYKRGSMPSSGMEYTTLMKTWEKFSADVLEADAFRLYLEKKGWARKRLEENMTLPVDPTDRARAIYAFVRDHFRWNGEYGYFADKTPDQLWEAQEGASDEINLLLCLLLRAADLEADPVLVSTRSHGRVFRGAPMLSQFNHLIANVHIDGKDQPLDAILGHHPYGCLPYQDLNEGLYLLHASKGRWLEPTQPATNVATSIQVNLQDPSQTVSEYEINYTGYEAVRMRQQLAKGGEEWLRKQWNTKGTLERLEIENLAALDKPLTIRCQLIQPSQAAGNRMYFQPDFQSQFDENPFSEAKRYYPIEFDYPFTEIFTMSVVLPPGLQVEELPKSLKAVTPDRSASIQYQSQQIETQIQIQGRSTLHQHLIGADQYHALRAFYDMTTNKLKEPLVLKRLTTPEGQGE
ncbi:Transglutaminase-like superfamily protein [Catalinimonas alkaloidigena]|uniref:Transglutaminase-like superfamily protein n=1 Tax=Catalinimonas alkaloidigena TaxID=1075417 RepID=A0A1G8ZRC0_9BACT|nr:DUF3857 domain-containing protein [Catalinimonas alkaloidigena]SDK17608.1 Transglutaminase-like superfamily protein [Catalinimonas alkaloidigena]